MTDTITIHDKSLETRQRELARELPESRTFMGGDACFGMRVDEEVYENARLANLESCGGRNVWDDPEFCRDMARRHPELVSHRRGTTFAVGAPGKESYGGLMKARSRHGKVATRVRFRGHLRIEDDFNAGVRTILNKLEGVERRFDLASGEPLEEMGDGEGSETISPTDAHG